MTGHNMDNLPIVEAEEKDGQFVITCPYCNGPHWHGLSEGHRISHCIDNVNPGYIIRRKQNVINSSE